MARWFTQMRIILLRKITSMGQFPTANKSMNNETKAEQVFKNQI